MPCHIRCRQMGFLLCFQNTSDFECLVTYSAAKWLSNCVHPVCFVKTPRVLNALSHLVQTNSFPPVFSQCVFSKHLGFECLVTCSAGKWRSSCVHPYSVFFQYLLDYKCLFTLGADKWLPSCVLPVCVFKTPLILNALSHQVQTNDSPLVFTQDKISKL